MMLDQIISNICLAGVQPQSGSFMIDRLFLYVCFLAQSFTALFSLLLKALGKKQIILARTVCAHHYLCFLPAKGMSE